MNPANPVSPKVIFGAIAAFIAPIVVAGILALLSWLMTDDGREVFRNLPLWVRIPLWAMIAAAASAIAGYRKSDPIRDDGLRARGVTPGDDASPLT